MPIGTIREQLRLMLEIVNHLERNLAGKEFQDFVANPDLAAGVERYLERISAALGHLPQTIQIRNPNVDWEGIIIIGNLLRHVYDRQLDRQVWQLAKSNLPELKRAVQEAIQDMNSGKTL